MRHVHKRVAILFFVVALLVVSAVPAFASGNCETATVSRSETAELTESVARAYGPHASCWNLGTGTWRVSWVNFPFPGLTIQLSVDGTTTYLYCVSGSGYQDYMANSVTIISWY